MSFMECTAMSMSPRSIACSISRVNRPLPPISFSGRSMIRSPVVWITQTSKASAGREKAAARRSRVSWACASASGEPRVPIFSGRSGEGNSRVMAMV